MIAHLRWAPFVAVVWTGLGVAQTQTGKEATQRPCEAEVRFADGSTVRVTLLQPSVDVQTRYGKLTIPVQEIRRIDLGLHLSEATQQRIEAAVKQLGSDAYKERDQAVRQLVALGAQAVPALHQAAKSRDLEAAHRAEAALEQIRARVPEQAQQVRADDLVETAVFPVVGRIVTPSLKARSAYFGDIDLRLTELRQVRLQGSAGDRDVLVDASKHGSAPGQWLDTGVEVSDRSRLRISAAGSVDLWPQTPGQYMTNPKGYGNNANADGALPGMLVGRVGESGNVFRIGDTYEGHAKERGRLFLHIVPSPWNNASSGSYRVQIMASMLHLGGS
jgi:hypothetical protein